MGRTWKRTAVDIVRSSETSVITVEVRTKQSRNDRVLLDDVKIRRRTKVDPTPKPTPKPTPRRPRPPRRRAAPSPTPTATPTTPVDVAGTLSNGCTFSARGLPSCGAYLGAAYGSNTDPAAMEAATGSRLGVRRTYFQGSQVDKAVAVSKSDIAAGRLPWISFKLPMSWEDMAAGKGDAWALDLSRKLAALDGPVWVAFHHEPEKDGNIAAWRAMQERLAPLVRNAAPNVAFTVITTGWNQLYGPAEYQLANIWPRGVKIDVAGFDVYNFHLTTRSDGSMLTKADRIKSDYFDKLATWAKANDTTWALAETGQTDESFAIDPGWIPRTHAEMEATGGVAMAYFNTALNSGGQHLPGGEPGQDRGLRSGPAEGSPAAASLIRRLGAPDLPAGATRGGDNGRVGSHDVPNTPDPAATGRHPPAGPEPGVPDLHPARHGGPGCGPGPRSRRSGPASRTTGDRRDGGAGRPGASRACSSRWAVPPRRGRCRGSAAPPAPPRSWPGPRRRGASGPVGSGAAGPDPRRRPAPGPHAPLAVARRPGARTQEAQLQPRDRARPG